MKPLISEFSYGYALTEELVNGRFGKLTGAPIFPSLIEEGRAGGGYDLNLPFTGCPLFIQFKLSYCMVRQSAAEWADFGHEYYRFYLRPSKYSRQHQLLRDLAAREEVYYAAPHFHTLDELNDAYMANQVFDRSALFNPLDIDLPDTDEHYVCFSAFTDYFLRCSNAPQKVNKKPKSFQIAESLLERVREKGKRVDDKFFHEISHSLLGLAKERGINTDILQSKKYQDTVKEKLKGQAEFAGYLARSIFETELFIVGERNV